MSADGTKAESLAAIIVSANSAHWLRPCLTTLLERTGDVRLDLIVVASGCTDDTVELVRQEFPQSRIVVCENRGFGFANNRALETIDADWVLFLNPDTEFLEGTMAELLAALRARPQVGLASVRQVTADGQVFPTIRRFPNAVRSLFESLGSERFPYRASWLGERELDLDGYDRETPCDWTTGAFMLARREALDEAGSFDERFFLYCEETDLCLRIKQAGWEIHHLPLVTILHHAGKAGWDPRLEAQAAYARRQYFGKHFGALHRMAATSALALGYGLRSASPDRERRVASRAALTTLLGLRRPPFELPPTIAPPASS